MTAHSVAIYQAIVLVACISTLLVTARSLPAQNVLAAAAVIVFTASTVIIIGEKTGLPFGPFEFTTNLAGAKILPWPIPLIWVAAILNSRGVARLVLRPLRQSPNYGYCSIGLTSLLAVLFDLNLEPFAVKTGQFWIWRASAGFPTWYGAPWTNSFGWLLAALLILVLATPWLIEKKPVNNPRLDFFPLLIWLTFNLLLASHHLFHHFWGAAIFAVLFISLVCGMVWKNSHP